jgi:hypothetical protein
MSLRALIRFTVNAGLMKPRRGFTPVAGKEKLGWARVRVIIDIPEGMAYF